MSSGVSTRNAKRLSKWFSGTNVAAGAKARFNLWVLSARLKSCPFAHLRQGGLFQLAARLKSARLKSCPFAHLRQGGLFQLAARLKPDPVDEDLPLEGKVRSCTFTHLCGHVHGLVCAGALAMCVATGVAQEPAQTSTSPVVLDRVVAVVNKHAILASDLDDEIRLSVLDPGRGGLGVLTRQQALEQLIARVLIQQQIRQEDETAAEPSQAEVDARLSEIRKELPACVRQNCASEAGWKAFLTTHGLKAERVDSYLRYRLEILRFIEQRFRQGIRITPQEIETYYRNTLLPQYAQGEATPSLDAVSPRIQEILLQQQVNALFGEWLQNLRKQGDVEVLDPALATPDAQSGTGGEGSQ